MFTLILQTGESIKGVAEGVAAEQLAVLFGKDVVVNRRVAFRPSGRVLRVEADRIALAEGDLEPWSRAPRPLLSNVDSRSLVVEQGPKSGLNAVYGRWPGDESDEEIETALAEIS